MTEESERASKSQCSSESGYISQTGLLHDLRKSGLSVESIERLSASGQACDGQLPILIDHLSENYHPNTKGAIALVISSSAARPYWDVIKREYLKYKENGFLYNTAIANVFFKTASRKDVPEIIELIESSPNPERLILLAILKKYRRWSPEAAAAIERYRHNPEFAKEIASWRPSKPKAAKPKPQ